MKTVLDNALGGYAGWCTESACIEYREFRLKLRRANENPGQSKGPCPASVEIHFESAALVQAFDEFARNETEDETGEPHVLARHTDSLLMSWVKEYTLLFSTAHLEEEVVHYSISASDNIYHVLADKPPKLIYDESDQEMYR